jgi:hypothetical protein
MQRQQVRGANGALSTVAVACFVLGALCQWSTARAQTRLPQPDAVALPEPIYWKQDLFLVPYQWSSSAGAGAAQAVWLFVSKDRGATWQKISEARPNVTSFNYRAEGDGEYWFAIRTIDNLNRQWPAGPYQPELRVVVDTTLPQISHLSAGQLADGTVAIVGLAVDANLDPKSLTVEAQLDSGGPWQQADIRLANDVEPAIGSLAAEGANASLRAVWQPPPGSRPVAIRATVLDRAGNPATFQAQLATPGVNDISAAQLPTAASTVPRDAFSLSPPAGWVSSSTALAHTAQPPAAQPWPGVVTHRAPFRLFSSGPTLPDDGVTTYGNVPAAGAANATDVAAHDEQRIAARYAGAITPWSAGPAGNEPRGADFPESADISQTPNYTAIEPFREASLQPVPAANGPAATFANTPTPRAVPTPYTPPAEPKLVGSRTFALEYDLDDVGHWAVTKVELWGTRDGGLTWHLYARDDDQHSPLLATVDEEGMYGFRIVVESTGAVAHVPAAGDEPELWVAVDLHRPVIELTAIERGAGNLADHLILRWRAADDNLEARPIALFYSSRPAGPWSAIATHLENTGEYAWRVERHVPSRFYLRAETRDVAGNLAAFQTREPVEFATLESGGQLRDTAPTAAHDTARY